MEVAIMANRGDEKNILIERSVMIPMRDGIHLCGDIYRPVDDEKHPVLMSVQGYDRNFFWQQHQLVLSPYVAVQKGYIALVVEDRGRYHSEGGEFKPYKHARKDTYDAVEWVAAQPWCDGNIGMYGPCYNGTDAFAAALEQAPHLKAIFTQVSNPDTYRYWAYQNGAMNLAFMRTWSVFLNATDLTNVGNAGKKGTGKDDRDFMWLNVFEEKFRPPTPEDTWERAPWTLPLKDDPLLLSARWWPEWLSHPTYDEYWKSFGLSTIDHAERVKVPTFTVSAWYDPTMMAHLHAFQEICKRSDPSIRKEHRFLVGPWDHHAYMNTRPGCSGIRNFKTETGQTLTGPLAIKFFDKHLRGKGDDGYTDGNQVRYFRMGENVWKDVPAWPTPHQKVNYYIHSEGGANTSLGNGILSTHAPKQESADSYMYDPRDPVMAVGGHSQMLTEGIHDRSEMDKKRKDMLVYTTNALEEDIVVEGPISVTLYASSSSEDTDFVAHLIDVEPDGFCCPISEGIVRARYRNSIEKEEFLTPGETTRFEIELADTAHMFQKGHKIRLNITSSCFPTWTRNLNSRVSPESGTEADIQTASQKVFHDSKYPTCITLPVVK
jgi:putative CocE/NonD family hydrolase